MPPAFLSFLGIGELFETLGSYHDRPPQPGDVDQRRLVTEQRGHLPQLGRRPFHALGLIHPRSSSINWVEVKQHFCVMRVPRRPPGSVRGGDRRSGV